VSTPSSRIRGGGPIGAAKNVYLPVSGQTDANGNAQVQVQGLEPGVPAAINLLLNVSGNAPIVAVTQGGIQVGTAGAISGQVSLGPIYPVGVEPLVLAITFADPNTAFQGYFAGIQSPNPADLNAVTGQTSLTVGTITSYDGQTLIAESTALGNSQHNADTTYPSGGGVFDVRNWASILMGFRMNTNALGNSLEITYRWFANPDGSRLVGQQSLLLDDIVGTAVATIANLGPYLEVVVNRLSGTTGWNWNASLLTSQRQPPNVYGGNFTPYLVEQNAVSVSGGATLDIPFGTVYAGPVWVAQRASGAQNGTFRITSLSTDGTYHAGNVFNNAVPNGTNEYQAVTVPAAPCRGEITNTGASPSAYSLVIYLSPTGSS
jgi:hypothetical protein